MADTLVPGMTLVSTPVTMDYYRTNTIAECLNFTFINQTNQHCTCPTLPPEGYNKKIIEHDSKWTPDVVQRIIMLSIIMTLTFFGNVTIIFVLTFGRYRKLNSRVNIFIINLAVGDLTVCCFTMTIEVLFVVFEKAWVLGAASCKILLYIQIITLASTTFILTAMSFDRYLAICKPLKFGSSSQAKKSIVVAWIMAFLFATPQLLIFKQVAVAVYYPDCEIKFKCKSVGYTAWWQRKLYITFMTIYILIVPAILICFCYINVVRAVLRQGKEAALPLRRSIGNKKTFPRAKVKTIAMTLCIIFSFILCWTPYFVVHCIHIWTEYQFYIPDAIYVLAETLALLNSALNPVIYGCFNLKIKRGVMEIFCPGRVKRHDMSRTLSNRVTECITVTEENHGTYKKSANKAQQSKRINSKPLMDKNNKKKKQLKSEEEKLAGFRLRVKFKNSDSCNADLVPTRSDDEE